MLAQPGPMVTKRGGRGVDFKVGSTYRKCGKKDRSFKFVRKENFSMIRTGNGMVGSPLKKDKQISLEIG